MMPAEECYRVSQLVYRTSFAVTAPGQAEDLIQDGAIAIWRGMKAYKAELSSEVTFASRLAKNAMIDSLRRYARPAAHESTTPDLTAIVDPGFEEDLSMPDATDLWHRIEAVLAHEPRIRHFRQIVAGRLAGLADTEIAHRLGVSKATLSREAARLAAMAAQTLGIGPSLVEQHR